MQIVNGYSLDPIPPANIIPFINKILYFLIGLLAGIWFTTNQAYVVIESLEQKWDREVLAFTLTGFSEGWDRGRLYSDKQNGFSDDWKLVSPALTPPVNVVEWVNINMTEFTGIVNAQYRDAKIIEIGLRLARGGAYIISTQNEALIKNGIKRVANGLY